MEKETHATTTCDPSAVYVGLMRLLGDYTLQALDDARQIAREEGDESLLATAAQGTSSLNNDEGPQAELLSRTHRISTVVGLVVEAQKQREKTLEEARSAQELEQAGSCAMIATRGLQGMFARISGTTIPQDSYPEEGEHHLRRTARSIGIAESSLEVFATNTRVAFRKSNTTTNAGTKRLRAQEGSTEASTGAATASTSDQRVLPDTCAALAEMQRKSRFALYTSRVALLPRVEAATATATSGICYASPAVRLFAQLTVAAEASFMQHAWRVHTKAQVLRQVPHLYAVSCGFRDELRDLLVDRAAAGEKLATAVPPYFEFITCNTGVVRVSVQRALYLDVTYDMKVKAWVLLQLAWNLWTACPSAAATHTFSSSSVVNAEACNGIPAATWARVQVNHQDAMVRFLRRQFAESGLDGGCLAANRLVCAVVMDMVVAGLQTAQQQFFVGPLRDSFMLEVRPGTFAACSVTPPALGGVCGIRHPQNPTEVHTTNSGHGRTTLHYKWWICGGTVVRQEIASTNADARTLESLIAVGLTRMPATGNEGVVIDVEQSLLQRALTA